MTDEKDELILLLLKKTGSGSRQHKLRKEAEERIAELITELDRLREAFDRAGVELARQDAEIHRLREALRHAERLDRPGDVSCRLCARYSGHSEDCPYAALAADTLTPAARSRELNQVDRWGNPAVIPEAETPERCPRGCDDGSVLEVTGPGLSGKRTLCTWPGHTSPPPEIKREVGRCVCGHVLRTHGGPHGARCGACDCQTWRHSPPPETKP